MKNILKISFIIFGVILAALSMAAIFGTPEVGEPETIKINYTPQPTEPEKNSVDTSSVYMVWNTKREWTNFSSCLVQGRTWLSERMLKQDKRIPVLYTK